ncbi:MAG TPA: siphovirus ReqiPepy6 Gp37-like family protein, partial [Actinoplanes sp.]
DPTTGTPGHTMIDLKPRHLEAGFGEFSTAADPDLLAAVNDPDNRVVVRRALDDGTGTTIEMAGPIELPENGYQAARDGSGGLGTLTVKFADDLVVLADRLVYPDPAAASTAQTTTTRYVITAQNPENALRALVNLNAGPGALTARRVPGLVLGPDNNLMPGVTVSTSFDRAMVLTDALREVARLPGGLGLGFRIVQVGGTLQFDVFQPQDLSNEIVFSRSMGNIAELGYSRAAPTATVAIVGDATAGVGRIVSERVNTVAHTAGWRRREVFVDARGVSNATERDQAGDEALAEGASKTRAAVTALETPDTRYGYDYGRGDLVSVQPYDGGPFITALVLGADITVTPDKGETVVPVIGTDNDVIVDAKAAEIRKLWRTIARLQGAL